MYVLSCFSRSVCDLNLEPLVVYVEITYVWGYFIERVLDFIWEFMCNVVIVLL
jgi:hypothetical protein